MIKSNYNGIQAPFNLNIPFIPPKEDDMEMNRGYEAYLLARDHPQIKEILILYKCQTLLLKLSRDHREALHAISRDQIRAEIWKDMQALRLESKRRREVDKKDSEKAIPKIRDRLRSRAYTGVPPVFVNQKQSRKRWNEKVSIRLRDVVAELMLYELIELRARRGDLTSNQIEDSSHEPSPRSNRVQGGVSGANLSLARVMVRRHYLGEDETVDIKTNIEVQTRVLVDLNVVLRETKDPQAIGEFWFLFWDNVSIGLERAYSARLCQQRWQHLYHPRSIRRNQRIITREDEQLILEGVQAGMSWQEIADKVDFDLFRVFQHYQCKLNPNLVNDEWTREDETMLLAYVERYKGHKGLWLKIALHFPTKAPEQCQNRYNTLKHNLQGFEDDGFMTDGDDVKSDDESKMRSPVHPSISGGSNIEGSRSPSDSATSSNLLPLGMTSLQVASLQSTPVESNSLPYGMHPMDNTDISSPLTIGSDIYAIGHIPEWNSFQIPDSDKLTPVSRAAAPEQSVEDVTPLPGSPDATSEVTLEDSTTLVGTGKKNRAQKKQGSVKLKPGLKKWTIDDDLSIQSQVMVQGRGNWVRIHINGGTDVKIRERYENLLAPGLRKFTWTAEEDQLLESVVRQHDPYHRNWSLISESLKGRTDADCLKRYYKLHPGDLALQSKLRVNAKLFLPNVNFKPTQVYRSIYPSSAPEIPSQIQDVHDDKDKEEVRTDAQNLDEIAIYGGVGSENNVSDQHVERTEHVGSTDSASAISPTQQIVNGFQNRQLTGWDFLSLETELLASLTGDTRLITPWTRRDLATIRQRFMGALDKPFSQLEASTRYQVAQPTSTSLTLFALRNDNVPVEYRHAVLRLNVLKYYLRKVMNQLGSSKKHMNRPVQLLIQSRAASMGIPEDATNLFPLTSHETKVLDQLVTDHIIVTNLFVDEQDVKVLVTTPEVTNQDVTQIGQTHGPTCGPEEYSRSSEQPAISEGRSWPLNTLEGTLYAELKKAVDPAADDEVRPNIF